jgi:hypothetical protein
VIKADVKVITGLAQRLAAASADGRKELMRATLTMRRAAKPTAGRIIRSKYTVKVGPLNSRLRAESVSGEYAIDLGVIKSDFKRKLPVEDFAGTRVTRKGVVVGLLKGRPAQLVPRSYVSPGGKSTGRKMRREGGSSYPIRYIGGMSANQMLFDDKLSPKIVDALLVRAGSEVSRRLARLKK